MKFRDFDLYDVIYDIYLSFEAEDMKPRSSDWFIFKNKRKILKNLVSEKVTGYKEEDILKAWDDFGKNKDKCKYIIETARQSNVYKRALAIFCSHSNSECSPFMSVEKTDNGAIIVCKKHNSEFNSHRRVIVV